MNHADLIAKFAPKGWEVQLGDAGRYAIYFAALAFIASFGFSLANRVTWAKWGFAAGFLGLVGAISALATLMCNHCYEYAYVFNHSSNDLKPAYLVSASWSGQEGSFLLWALTSAIFGLFALPKVGGLSRWFTAIYSGFLASLAAILTYESPFAHGQLFETLWLKPPDGRGLNASLMNYWDVIHPPTIFLGFGSLTVLFAWAWAAMIQKDVEDWAVGVRPWALVSSALLGLGLSMGGFWAYETLGWGGFWAWDPVETTSFVPWCASLALVHGIIVQQSRKKSHFANFWLAAAPFLLFCYGTFLTRSGFLGDASVHSFTEMNKSALWILVGIMAAAMIGFGATYAYRLKDLRPLLPKPIVSEGTLNKENFYSIGIWLTSAIALFSGIGMSVPLIQSLMNQKPKVADPVLYQQVLVWPYLPLMVLVAVAPLLSWKPTTLTSLLNTLTVPFSLALGSTGLLLVWLKLGNGGLAFDQASTSAWFGGINVPTFYWVGALLFFSFFVIYGNIARLARYAPKDWIGRAGLVSHIGLAVFLFGMIGSKGFERKTTAMLNQAYPSNVFGDDVYAVGRTSQLTDPDNKINLKLVSKNGAERSAQAGLYYMQGDGGNPAPMSWPGINPQGLDDMYYVAHELTFDATDATPLQQGESRAFKGNSVKYLGLKTEGTLGQPGAGFIAEIEAETPTGLVTLQPKLTIGQKGLEYTDAHLTDQLDLHLESIDAKDKSASIQIKFRNPAYLATIFYKPLTRFVWIGVGIMTLGGLLAAYARRRPRRVPDRSESRSKSGTPARAPSHATASSSEV